MNLRYYIITKTTHAGAQNHLPYWAELQSNFSIVPRVNVINFHGPTLCWGSLPSLTILIWGYSLNPICLYFSLYMFNVIPKNPI